MDRPNEDRDPLALVMSGGGALAAYQVGLMRHLADHYPNLHVPIISGVSAGAINAAMLAGAIGSFRERVDVLEEAWCSLSPDRVFRLQSLHLFSRVLRFGLRLLSGKSKPVVRPRSLLDTAPLREYLCERLCGSGPELQGVAQNLSNGELSALAITAESYTTDESITWVQSAAPSTWERGRRLSKSVTMTVDHVMASAALPLVFPAVEVDGHWFGDGGMRLTAPFAPAIHLGAQRILAISTRTSVAVRPSGARQPYPSPAHIAGTVLNSLFLEHSSGDALRVQRINQLIDGLPEGRRHGLRPIELLVVHPSVDLGALANDYEPHLPRALRFLLAGLGTSESRSNDLVSLLMVQTDYLKALIDIGRRDAEARHGELAAFLNQA